MVFRSSLISNITKSCSFYTKPCWEKATLQWISLSKLACEQAPGLEERSKGAKRRGRGACTQISEFLMSASKFWTQSADWWILIIHDVILVVISGRDSPMWFCGCDACYISLQILTLMSLFLVIFLFCRILSGVLGRQFWVTADLD